MRLLVVGLALIAVAIGLSQYVIRHPTAGNPQSTVVDAGSATPDAPPPPDGKHLAVTKPFQDAERPALEPLQGLIESCAARSSAGGWATVLKGNVRVALAMSSGSRVVLVLSSGELSGLVELSAKDKPRALVATKAPADALAVGDAVAWAEGGRLFTLGSDGVTKPLTELEHARVTSMAWSSAGQLAVTLMPKELDPMTTEPEGVVAVVSAEGRATPLVAGQVRPRGIIGVEPDLFFVAGYPPALMRATNDGAFSGEISKSAEAPLVFDGEGILFRYPFASGPEVRRVARAGGSMKTMFRGSVDAFAAPGGAFAFTTSGFGARLMQQEKGAEEPVELLQLKGTAKELTVLNGALVLVTTSDDGVTTVRLKE